MKSEKEIKDRFNELWKALGKGDVTDNIIVIPYLQALDWVMDGKLIKKKINEVIK